MSHLTRLKLRGTNCLRLSLPVARADAATFLPALEVLDLRCQNLPELPVRRDAFARLRVLRLGWPGWLDLPPPSVGGGARAARDAGVRKAFDVTSLALPLRAWPGSLEELELCNARLEVEWGRTEIGEAAGAQDRARALAWTVARVTVPGLCTLILRNVGMADPVLTHLLAAGGRLLVRAYREAGHALEVISTHGQRGSHGRRGRAYAEVLRLRG